MFLGLLAGPSTFAIPPKSASATPYESAPLGFTSSSGRRTAAGRGPASVHGIGNGGEITRVQMGVGPQEDGRVVAEGSGRGASRARRSGASRLAAV